MQFVNETPVDDVWTALDLLVCRWGDETIRELIRWHDEKPFIELAHIRAFGCDTIRYFLVTDRLADELRDRHFISGKPCWGYTDMRILRANEFGERALWDKRKELATPNNLVAEYWLLEMARAEGAKPYLRF